MLAVAVSVVSTEARIVVNSRPMITDVVGACVASVVEDSAVVVDFAVLAVQIVLL